MQIVPGMLVMPTVLMNLCLSFFRDKGLVVRGSDTLCVALPMYNEERGAQRALLSLLDQDELPDEIAASINGGSDATYSVVKGTLRGLGFELGGSGHVAALNANTETWWHPELATLVKLACYRVQVGKSDSLNNLVEHGVVSADRILVVDGDTVLEPTFIRELRDNFYRLTRTQTAHGTEWTLHDYGMQSGAVMSHAPGDAASLERFISAGREAEYAFGCMLRDGQSKRLGDSALFGASRLYTVIGCGFSARRELFPVPSDTKTEDHDLTLQSQNRPPETRETSLHGLSERGFRVVLEGAEFPLESLIDRQDRVHFRRSGDVRFVHNALMKTQDPPHMNGYLHQVERWNGGAQQNVLKRLGEPLRPNVKWAVWTSLLENLLGITLLFLLPAGVALHLGNPSIGIPPEALLTAVLIDILVMTLLATYGFHRYHRARGEPSLVAFLTSLGAGVRTALPFALLRYLNPLTYVASATTVVPAYLGERKRLPHVMKAARRKPKAVNVWERPLYRQATRTQHVLTLGVVSLLLSMTSLAHIAPRLAPMNYDAWRLIYAADTSLDIEDFSERAVLNGPPAAGFLSLTIGTEPFGPMRAEARTGRCDPTATPNIIPTGNPIGGESAAYEPLGGGYLLALARLAPIAPLVEEAALAYDVPQALLLRVLLNESYLDPLAEGPTEDKGLSQMTSEALTMLQGLASDPEGRFYNPRLFGSAFSVFDPEFSLCAGAAKLAWALSQPDVDSDREAYALYINPVHGLVSGSLSRIHTPLTAGIDDLEPMAKALEDVYATYREAPERLTETERKLADISHGVARGSLTTEEGYRKSLEVVRTVGIEDEAMYERLFAEHFTTQLAVSR